LLGRAVAARKSCYDESVRLAQAGTLALTSMLSVSCVRFGYGASGVPSEGPDAAQGGNDASFSSDPAGASGAAGKHSDATVADAASGAVVSDSSTDTFDASVSDAARMPADSAVADDGAMQAPTDSGAQDAGSLDAAVVDGSTDFCPERADALFCNGFDTPVDFSVWTYALIDNNGGLGSSTEPRHSGTGALRATTGAAGEVNAARYGSLVFPHQVSGEIWLRYYYYLPSSTVVTTGFSTGVVAEVEPPFFGFALLVRSTRVEIGVLDTMYPGTMAFPRDHWTCVELRVQIDATAGKFEAYLDGKLAAYSPDKTNTLPAKGYTSVDVGIHYTDPEQGPVQAYVDDVVAGNQRPGCD